MSNKDKAVYGIPVLGLAFCFLVVMLPPLRRLIVLCAEIFLVHRNLNFVLWNFKLISFALQGIFVFGISFLLIHYVNSTKNFLSVFVTIMVLLFVGYIILFLNNPQGHQKNLLFLGADDLFADILNPLRYVQDRDPYFNDINGLKEHAYPPFVYLILYPFSRIYMYENNEYFESLWNSKILIFYAALITGLEMVFLFEALKKMCKINNVSSMVLLAFSGYFISTFERGNIIILSIACTVLFLCWYDSGEKRERVIALFCLAVAVAMKGYPVIFGFLYFEKKQYKEIAISACVAFILIVAPFFFFKNGYKNAIQMFHNLKEQNLFYRPRSGYSLISGNSIFYHLFDDKEKIHKIMNIIVALLVFSSIAVSVFIKNKWEKITLLSLSLLYFPVFSGGYCLGYFLVSIILFFSTISSRSFISNITIIIIYILILNPIQYVLVPFESIQMIVFGKSITIWNLLISNAVLALLWVMVLFMSTKKEFVRNIGKIFCPKPNFSADNHPKN
jgi:hypothetical protein